MSRMEMNVGSHPVCEVHPAEPFFSFFTSSFELKPEPETVSEGWPPGRLLLSFVAVSQRHPGSQNKV